MVEDKPGKREIILWVLLTIVFLPLLVILLYKAAGQKYMTLSSAFLFSVLMLPLLLVQIFLLLLFFGTWSNAHPEFGEHVPRVEWLPALASDVSFYKTYSYTSYEFKISEKDFREWANPSWQFSEVSEPAYVSRYNDIYENEKYRREYPNGDDDAFNELQKKTNTKITNGIFAVICDGDSNGGGVWAAYDRDTGTAYFHSHPR
ncbi:MAG: hypothetical protein AB7F40_09725 [Victivallaceae bacterium]|nr:hypothetical protein [Victivallaceae bacterium]